MLCKEVLLLYTGAVTAAILCPNVSLEDLWPLSPHVTYDPMDYISYF